MRIYELDLHYELCRPYVFVLILTNKTDGGGKCYFYQKFQVKKYKPSLFQYICANHIVTVSFKTIPIVNLNAILHTAHELFVRASYLKKCTIMCLCQKMQNASYKHNGNIADVWLVTKYLASIYR